MPRHSAAVRLYFSAAVRRLNRQARNDGGGNCHPVLRRFALIPRQTRNDGNLALLLYIYLIKFCFTQNFLNYYLLSLIYYLNSPPPIISTEVSVSERSGEIKALAALTALWVVWSLPLPPLMRNAAAGMRRRYAIRRFIAIVGEEELTRLRVCRALRRYSPVAPQTALFAVRCGCGLAYIERKAKLITALLVLTMLNIQACLCV